MTSTTRTCAYRCRYDAGHVSRPFSVSQDGTPTPGAENADASVILGLYVRTVLVRMKALKDVQELARQLHLLQDYRSAWRSLCVHAPQHDARSAHAYRTDAAPGGARSATLLHQGPAGQYGQPVLAFRNPTNATATDDDNDDDDDDDEDSEEPQGRASYGCLDAPFTTGVVANGCALSLC